MTTLRSYMDRITRIYTEANKEYVAKLDAMRKADESISRVDTDRTLSAEGRQKKRELLKQLKVEIRKELDAINAKAKADADTVRGEVERDFCGMYSARPEDVDSKTVELLKSGILTDTELTNLANQYRTNAAMRRIIGSYAKQREGREMQTLANICMRASDTPHLDTIDTLCNTLNYIVGDAPLSGIYGAEAIGRKVDTITAEIYRDAPDISWGRDDAGNVQYSISEG